MVDSKLWFGVTVTTLLLTLRAEATERAPRPAVVKTLRFTIPFTDNTIVNGNRTDSTALGLALPVARRENDTWPLRVSRDHDYRHGVDIGGAVGWSF